MDFDEVKDKATDAVEDVKEKVSDVVEDVKDKIGGQADKAKDQASDTTSTDTPDQLRTEHGFLGRTDWRWPAGNSVVGDLISGSLD